MSNTIVEFALSNSAQSSIVGERTVSFSNFTINEPAPDSVYKGDAVVQLREIKTSSDCFWIKNTFATVSEAEAKVYSNIDSLDQSCVLSRHL